MHDTRIVSLTKLTSLIVKEKKENKRIVFTNGCFDILHPGHIEYLRKASLLGDKLVVAVNSNASIRAVKGYERPINDIDYRLSMLDALLYPDWIVEFDELTPRFLIELIIPDVLVKGGDYDVSDIVGSDIVIQNGGVVKTIDYVAGYSTTQFIDDMRSKICLS